MKKYFIIFQVSVVDGTTGEADLYLTYQDSGGSFESLQLDTLGTTGIVTDSEIRLDSNGYPHIMYMDSRSADLKYAWFDGSSWNVEVAVPGASAATMNVSFDLDSNDVPHVVFYSIAETLVYFNRIPGTWQGDAIDDDGDSHSHPVRTGEYSGYERSVSDNDRWTVPIGGPTTETILTFPWPSVSGSASNSIVDNSSRT